MDSRYKQATEILREEGFISLIQAFLWTIWYDYIVRFLAYTLIRVNRKDLVLKKIHGNKMYLKPIVKDIEDISTELYVTGTHESAATKIFRKQLTKGMRVMDIGANIGYFALIEAQILAIDGEVYAIEPVPNNFDLLKTNVELNAFSNIRLFQFAIADYNGFSKIYLSKYSNWHSLIRSANSSDDYIIVETITLDKLLEVRGEPVVDYIRMDVEGFEGKIIRGMTHTLTTNSNLRLFIEFHPNLIEKIEGQSVKMLLEKLASFGFEPSVVVIKNRNKVIQHMSMEELLRNNHILNKVFHVFLQKSKLPAEKTIKSGYCSQERSYTSTIPIK
jgi:FkbM family methyltransferase